MDVNKIMTESFDMLLNRDNNLKQIVHDSDNLKEGAKNVSRLNTSSGADLCELCIVKERRKETEILVMDAEVYDAHSGLYNCSLPYFH